MCICQGTFVLARLKLPRSRLGSTYFRIFQWTVQNVDSEKDYYRLYVNDGQKDYALHASEDGTTVNAHEAKPSSLDSHVWLIPHLGGEFFG